MAKSPTPGRQFCASAMASLHRFGEGALRSEDATERRQLLRFYKRTLQRLGDAGIVVSPPKAMRAKAGPRFHHLMRKGV